MKTTEYLFVTLASVVACAAMLTVPSATAGESQAGSPAAQRESLAGATPTPEVAVPTPTASEASQRDDDARDGAEADTQRWPDEDDESEDR